MSFPAGSSTLPSPAPTAPSSISFRSAAVLLDEPDQLTQEFDRFWTRVAEVHERSGVGNLVRPEDLYLASRRLVAENFHSSRRRRRAPRHHSRPRRRRSEISFLTQPSPRFHGAVPADACRKSRNSTLMASAFSSPSPTSAKSSASPMSSPNTTSPSGSAAALAAAKVMPTKPATSPEKSSPPRSPQPTSPKAFFCPKPISPSSAHAISSTNPTPSPLARSARNPKSPLSSPTSAISRSETTSSTSSTASASIKA